MNKRIEKLDNFGRGITYLNNKITFINNALEEELIEIKPIEEHKKYIIAENIKVLDKSINREHNTCKYYNICGGCNTFHMKEEKELDFKKERARNILLRYAGIDIKDIELISKDLLNYRSKITLRVVNHKLGLLKEKSNEIVEIDNCLLVNNKINKEIELLKELIKEEDIEKIVIRTSTNEVMLQLYGNVKHIDKFINISDSLYINNKCITNPYITKEIGNKKYHVRDKSFFQVNDQMVKYLYDEVKDNIIKLNSKKVIDLYCGVGSIGIYIADKVEKVLGIEIIEEAIIDAKENAKLNNLNNIEFICSDVSKKLNILKYFDTVIVDPPRSGLNSKTRNFLNNFNNKYLIYVSCDLMTLSRDLKELNNYELKSIKLFNLFGRTYHVESICILERN